MVMALPKIFRLPANKVVGMAGILDSSRFKLFLSLELNVACKEIDAMVWEDRRYNGSYAKIYKVSGKPLLDLS
jgi:malate dehydrogenase